jgi:predicted small lipoprotein YifL
MAKAIRALCLASVCLLTLAGCGKQDDAGPIEAPPVSTEPGPGMRQDQGTNSQSGAQPQPVPRGPNPEDSPSNVRGYDEPKFQDPLDQQGG